MGEHIWTVIGSTDKLMGDACTMWHYRCNICGSEVWLYEDSSMSVGGCRP